MQCGSEIIDIGTAKYEVQQACGVPTSEEELGSGNELWVYNFGSDSLVYYVMFNGIEVSRIQTAGFGN
jgi:hypothetical protein